MKKTYLLALLTLGTVLGTPLQAQLVTYDFEGDVATPSEADGNVSGSSFSRNIESFNFSTGSPGRAINGSRWSDDGLYWEFTVTANPGLALDLSNLSFDYRRTSTGPASFNVEINGSSAFSGNMNISTGSSEFYSVSEPLIGFSGLTTVQVRIHGNDASNNNGTFRMDNVTLNGLAVTPVPEPSTWLLLGGGLTFLAVRLRQRK